MATPVLISPEEYLKTTYIDLDREYVHGEILERSMPTFLHGKVQALLCILFGLLRRQYPIIVVSEVRHAIEKNALYRIPDVAVFAGEAPKGQYPEIPPLVAIEIASPDDRLSETLRKFSEYLAWRIPNVWLIDPEEAKLYVYDETGLHPVKSLQLPQYDFTITLADLELPYQ
jgi:Uma2 family endonuclease